jgi:hypothetical protein
VPLGDRSRVLFGRSEVGPETTLYVQRGALLIRVSAASPAGDATDDAYGVARGIVSAAG